MCALSRECDDDLAVAGLVLGASVSSSSGTGDVDEGLERACVGSSAISMKLLSGSVP